MDQSKLMGLAVAGAAVFLAWKYGNGLAKAVAVSIGSVMVAKQVPYVKDYV